MRINQGNLGILHSILKQCLTLSTAVMRNQFQRGNLLLKPRKNFGRQTDGLRFVVSLRAVLKMNLHQRFLSVARDRLLLSFLLGFLGTFCLGSFLCGTLGRGFLFGLLPAESRFPTIGILGGSTNSYNRHDSRLLQ